MSVSAVNGELFDELYTELQVIARGQMSRESPGHTLQPTALINEAYLKLRSGQPAEGWKDDHHFLSTVAKVMRRILIDSARAKATHKRGEGLVQVELKDHDVVEVGPQDDVFALNEALLKFAKNNEVQARLVELRYFAGLSVTEAAEVLKISRATAHNYWNYSRAWLHRELTSEG